MPNLPALIFDYSYVLHFPDRGLNTDLLLFLQSALQGKFPLHILTASTGWQQPEILSVLQPVFAAIHTTDELGSKADPETFRRLGAKIGIPVGQMLLIDDTLENIQAIERAGGQGIRYESNSQLIEQLRQRSILPA